MRYIQLKEAFKDFTVFSLRDIRSFDKGFHRRRLSDWQEKGYIRKVINGYYVFTDLDPKEDELFEIANRIYSPSYVSLQTALAYHRLIPETVYAVTSVSTRRTRTFRSGLGAFDYRTVQPSFFFGYQLKRGRGGAFKIASPVKALLDHLYLNPGIRAADDFRSLRLDGGAFFELITEEGLAGALERLGKKGLAARAQGLWKLMEAEGAED